MLAKNTMYGYISTYMEEMETEEKIAEVKIGFST